MQFNENAGSEAPGNQKYHAEPLPSDQLAITSSPNFSEKASEIAVTTALQVPITTPEKPVIWTEHEFRRGKDGSGFCPRCHRVTIRNVPAGRLPKHIYTLIPGDSLSIFLKPIPGSRFVVPCLCRS